MESTLLNAVEPIVKSRLETNANLGLLGDKRFLLNDKKRIRNVRHRESLLDFMGDPVGSDESISDLVWKFRELCDQYDGWPVFYQVDKEHLSVYLEQVLTPLKIGEEAYVPIQDFSIEGQHKSLRTNRNKLAKSGLSFEIVDQANVLNIMPRLRSISDAWLIGKACCRKRLLARFLFGRVFETLSLCRIKSGETIIAFANLWQGAGKSELSIDLMRYDSSGPNGLMDFCSRTFAVGKAEGYQWFNMGMAPLSGIENRPLAPLWNKALEFAYRHGDHFYSFEGLRQYKQKFDPVWRPKYLACPGA